MNSSEKHKFEKKTLKKLKQTSRRFKYKQESRLSHILILLDYITNLEQ